MKVSFATTMIFALLQAGTQAVSINSLNQLRAEGIRNNWRERAYERIDDKWGDKMDDWDDMLERTQNFGDKLGGKFGERISTMSTTASEALEAIQEEEQLDDILAKIRAKE